MSKIKQIILFLGLMCNSQAGDDRTLGSKELELMQPLLKNPEDPSDPDLDSMLDRLQFLAITNTGEAPTKSLSAMLMEAIRKCTLHTMQKLRLADPDSNHVKAREHLNRNPIRTWRKGT